MTAYKTDINFEALFYALAAQTEPLPEPLQQAFRAVGIAPENHRLDALQQLRQQIKHYSSFEADYNAGIQQALRQYTSQARAKGATVMLPPGIDFELLLESVFGAPDPVKTAQQRLKEQQQAITQATTQSTSGLWDKADRIAVMTAGGAALGGAIAQLPGAIVGSLVGAGYGFYISAVRSNTTQHPPA